MSDNSPEWPIELTRRIGTAISDARKAQNNMSVVKLAARTTELGYPIHRVAISKLESGERAITVPELVILAAALNTVPLALLLPGSADEKIEILPSNAMPGAAAIGWFTGTTSATPDGVTRDPSMTQVLELMTKLNEVNEYLGIQRHNLNQAKWALNTLRMSDAFRENQLKLVEDTREAVKTLEEQRDQIIHLLAKSGDRDGG